MPILFCWRLFQLLVSAYGAQTPRISNIQRFLSGKPNFRTELREIHHSQFSYSEFANHELNWMGKRETDPSLEEHWLEDEGTPLKHPAGIE